MLAKECSNPHGTNAVIGMTVVRILSEFRDAAQISFVSILALRSRSSPPGQRVSAGNPPVRTRAHSCRFDRYGSVLKLRRLTEFRTNGRVEARPAERTHAPVSDLLGR